MKNRTQLAATALLSGLTLTAWAADPQHLSAGQRYYAQICAKCHEAQVGPNLLGRGLPPEYFVAIARNGLNAMPAFRITDIDDATLQSLGEYLNQTKAPEATEPAKR